LLSAEKQKMLNDLIGYHEIEKYFYKVCGLTDHYANSKIDAGKSLINDLECLPIEVIMIGDTLHDAEVAVEIGAQCALIAHGHTTYERLLESGENVFHNLFEFIEWFKKQ